MLHAHLKTMASARRHHFQRFALGVLDVDNFKLVNDSFGHMIGDRLLAEIARRLRSNLREYDIVARLGGDEFVCIWTDVDIVRGFIPRPDRVFGQPYLMADGVYLQSVKGSLGVVLYPEHGEDPNTLLGNADQAMYKAKFRGGDCVEIFQDKVQADVLRNYIFPFYEASLSYKHPDIASYIRGCVRKALRQLQRQGHPGTCADIYALSDWIARNVTSFGISDALAFPITTHLAYIGTKPRRFRSFPCQLSEDDQPEKRCSRSVDDAESVTTAAHYGRARPLSISQLVLSQRCKAKPEFWHYYGAAEWCMF
ncbi:hypothetical protein CNMCM8980_002948 [Aspergillus fumigatiaffinis]|nr:hypothetical protein CNMCM8980_002948 [Aspergillus fumigatiaffinis]